MTKSLHEVSKIDRDKVKKETHDIRICVEDMLSANGINCVKIDKRPKSIAGVLRKKDYLEKQLGRELEFLEYTYDLRGIRIITKHTSDCYKTLEVLTENREIEILNDYIKNPWRDGYKSIHVTTYFNNLRVQFQIRSTKIHHYAEYLKEKYGEGYWREIDFKRQ